MNIKAHRKVEVPRGEIELQVKKPNGDLETLPITNKILNEGMKRLYAQDDARTPWDMFRSYFAVGRGTTEIGFFDSTLTDQVTKSGNETLAEPTGQRVVINGKPYRKFTATYQFGIGDVVGNIGEMGLCASNDTLWTFALVRDTDGNPTTITVLEEEQLAVIYSFFIHFSDDDDGTQTSGAWDVVEELYSGVHSVGGTDTQVTITSLTGRLDLNNNNETPRVFDANIYSPLLNAYRLYAYWTNDQDQSQNLWVNGDNGGPTVTRTENSTGFVSQVSGRVTPAAGNMDIERIRIGSYNVNIFFDPPIPKTENDDFQFSFDYEISWSDPDA